MPVASRSIICRCRRQRQIIDVRATDNSRYFAITEFRIIVLSFTYSFSKFCGRHEVQQICTITISEMWQAMFTLCLFELLFKNHKCACVNRYFAIENRFQKCACMPRPLFAPVICSWRQTYYSHQLFAGKLANQRWENE